MRSWQLRDSMPSACGWLWIGLRGYPRLPRIVHETIHEQGGHDTDHPQPSTISQQQFPTMWMMMRYPYLKTPPRATHHLSTTSRACPHIYPQGVGRWVGVSGGSHERLLMHTRGELSTFSGLLSTQTMLVHRRWKGVLSRRISGKIGLYVPLPIHPH